MKPLLAAAHVDDVLVLAQVIRVAWQLLHADRANVVGRGVTREYDLVHGVDAVKDAPGGLTVYDELSPALQRRHLHHAGGRLHPHHRPRRRAPQRHLCDLLEQASGRC